MSEIINTYTVGGVLGIVLVVGLTKGLTLLLHLTDGQQSFACLISAFVVAGLGALSNRYPELANAVYYFVVGIVLWLVASGVVSVGTTMAGAFRPAPGPPQAPEKIEPPNDKDLM
jgi:hypothetical protein